MAVLVWTVLFLVLRRRLRDVTCYATMRLSRLFLWTAISIYFTAAIAASAAIITCSLVLPLAIVFRLTLSGWAVQRSLVLQQKPFFYRSGLSRAPPCFLLFV